MKHRVLIITGVFYPEPVASAGIMKELATELSKEYLVTVLRPKPSRPMGFQMPDYSYSSFPFEVIETDSYVHPASTLFGRFRESYSMGAWCANYIHHHHDDICLIYNGSWHMIGRNMIAKTAMKYNIPYITPVQDIYPESLSSKLPKVPFLKIIVNRLLLPSDRYLLQNAAKVHTISEKMVDFLSETRHLSKSHFVVVRNWQDELAFIEYAQQHSNEKKQDEPFTFMYLGNVGQLAGIDALFSAVKKAQLPNTRLVIAGSGSAKDHLTEIAKTYKDCQIEFWDVPAGDVPKIQSQADVMMLPVKKGYALSSIPSKLPAYWFSSKPVIASVDEDSDTASCIKESDAGWIASPEDVESIATTMRNAYSSSQEELRAKGKRGFDYAIEHFTKQSNLKKLVDACISVI